MLLKNQFIMAPLKLGYSDDSGTINDKHIQFYRERSKHIGAITPEPLYLEKGLREIPTQIGIDNDDKIAGLKKLTDLIHANGAKVIAHLSHPGRMANPKLPGNYYLSSTDKPCENGGAVPKRMDTKDMESVEKLFVDAAVRAKKAGFDIIELQFGHGYLLSQFLSPAVNDRSDEYGGKFVNRSRFPLSVLDAVKKSVKLSIIVRVSAEEMTPNGIKIEETIELVKLLKQRGVEAVHVSAGTVCSTPPWFFQHMFVPKGKTWDFASKIKNAVNIPVIFVGRINSPADVDKIQTHYKAAYIALGRALVADPDFTGKYLGLINGAIRPCLACSEGCLGGVKSGQGLHCVINPLVGYNDEPFKPADNKKKYAVIGAGLAGMQAALILNERGHEAVLYEKDKIGGQFNLAWLPPNKESLREIIDYFESELKQKSIPVFQQEATAQDLLSKNYDGILLATGAVPTVPPINGLKEYYWAKFLEEENLPENQKIVVIGGGLIGIEIASKLVEQKNDVIIVEMLDEVALGMEMIEKTLTLKKLNMKHVPIYKNTKVEAVDGDKVYLSGERQITLENIDKIVIATGMKSYHPLVEELEGKIPVYLIGDAKKVGKAQDAIRDAFVTAMEL
jgi:2,4-dienoyl-CoA reductase-like NADH-dependent reductase (Old Yellow Enzyme family)/thioredoxin reductase